MKPVMAQMLAMSAASAMAYDPLSKKRTKMAVSPSKAKKHSKSRRKLAKSGRRASRK